MSERRGDLRGLLTVCILPLVLVIFAALVGLAVAGPQVGQMISLLGTIGWLFAAFAWVTFSTSRKRWPGVGTFTRLSRMLTFYRDED